MNPSIIKSVAIMLILAPLVSGTTTTIQDNNPDSFTGHVGAESVTVVSDGTDVSFVVNVDAFSTSQPLTEYYVYYESEDYRAFWVECTVEGTGTGYSTACSTTAMESSVPPALWDLYYSLGIPILAAHRLNPTYVTSTVSHTLVFDSSAGEIGASLSYADLGFSPGEDILVNIFGADDGTDWDYATPAHWLTLA